MTEFVSSFFLRVFEFEAEVMFHQDLEETRVRILIQNKEGLTVKDLPI